MLSYLRTEPNELNRTLLLRVSLFIDTFAHVPNYVWIVRETQTELGKCFLLSNCRTGKLEQTVSRITNSIRFEGFTQLRYNPISGYVINNFKASLGLAELINNHFRSR